MTSMKDLIDLSKEQGFLEYSVVVKILKEEKGLMSDQIEDIVELLENLGVNVLRDK